MAPAPKTFSAGDSGAEVAAFRKALLDKGTLPKSAPANDKYDHWMVQAVANFQRKQKLIPTGIATPDMQALMLQKKVHLTAAERLELRGDEVLESLTAHMRNVQSPQEALLLVPQPVSSLNPSRQGLMFLAQLEQSISDFYIPGEKSGITTGIGYDMGERDSNSVQKDLRGAKIWAELPAKTQQLWMSAADLDEEYPVMKLFTQEEHNTDVLTGDQAWRLFDHMVRKDYVPTLKRELPSDLHLTQPQFDALVAYVYNVGSLPKAAIKAFKQKPPDIHEALRVMNGVVTSGGNVEPGLPERREKEARLFLYGHYGDPRLPQHRRMNLPKPKIPMNRVVPSLPPKWRA